MGGITPQNRGYHAAKKSLLIFYDVPKTLMYIDFFRCLAFATKKQKKPNYFNYIKAAHSHFLKKWDVL